MPMVPPTKYKTHAFRIVTATVGMEKSAGIVWVVKGGTQLWLTAHVINWTHGANLVAPHCMSEATRNDLRHWVTEVLHIITCMLTIFMISASPKSLSKVLEAEAIAARFSFNPKSIVSGNPHISISALSCEDWLPAKNQEL